MAPASDYAYFDEERGEWGYWLDDGRTWVPSGGNPAHWAEVND